MADDYSNIEPTVPTTPEKRTSDAVLGAEGTPTTPSKKIRRAGKPKGSTEEISDMDKKMIKMKDEEGKSWSQIGTWWAKETGNVPGKSTLGNRYLRLKANMSEMSDADKDILKAAKVEVETTFEKEKWGRIATAMEKNGASKSYSAAAVQKEFKKMAKA